MNNVYVRVTIYVLSTLLGMIPASAAGLVWVEGDVLSVSISGLVTAVSTGGALSAGVFKWWGTK